MVDVNLGKILQRELSTHGMLLFRTLLKGEVKGMEILALDNGPVMENVAKYLQGGFSTAGSMGVDLGSVARLSDYCNIYFQGGKGTVFLAQLWPLSIPLQA